MSNDLMNPTHPPKFPDVAKEETVDLLPDDGIEDILGDSESELVTYFAVGKEWTLTLRSLSKRNVDGFVEIIPSYTARFREHYYHTRDKVMIKALDKLRTGTRARKFAKKFWKIPSKEQQDEYSKRAEKINAEKQKVDEKYRAKEADLEVEKHEKAKKKAESRKPKIINSGQRAP